MKNKKIAVLYGGWNSEREVSLNSGNAVFNSLMKMGYNAFKIDFSDKIVDDLISNKPDIIFNALHGKYGEDGRIQGMLDIMQIPYTHSGVLASALCMDKVLFKKLALFNNILSPKFEIIKKADNQNNIKKINKIGYPMVIKPIADGSSIGVEVHLTVDSFDLNKYSWKFGDEMIIENYIAGQEIHIAIMDGKALGAIEVRPHGLFYNYKCKYTSGMTDYIMPAEIDKEKYDEALALAEKSVKIAGCRGIARVDFILNNKNDGDNKFYLLEVNTHPGFTATSLVPKIAQYVGISFDDIIEFLIKNAKCD